MSDDIVAVVWKELKKDIADLKAGNAQLHDVTEQAQAVDNIPAYTFANLPTTGLANGTSYITLAWVTNGRKSGEGGGAGTGVLAVYNPGTATWKRVGEDYNDVTV